MQTLVAYVENKPGVLNRVSSLARRLAINIDSLTVGPTENEEIARMTIVAHTDERGAHRLEASLEKLVDVLLAENVSTRALLERDLALIKVSADQQNRPHLMELIKVFRARVVDVAPESLIIEVAGTGFGACELRTRIHQLQRNLIALGAKRNLQISGREAQAS